MIQRDVGAGLPRCGLFSSQVGHGRCQEGLGDCGPLWAEVPGEDSPGILHKELPRPSGERGAGIRPGFHFPGRATSSGNAGRISLRTQQVFGSVVHFAEGVLFSRQNRSEGSEIWIPLGTQGLFRGSGENFPHFTVFWRYLLEGTKTEIRSKNLPGGARYGGEALQGRWLRLPLGIH